MQKRYFTKKGSLYIQNQEGGKEFWIKAEENGKQTKFEDAVHISKRKLTELIREYPSTLLDKTYCFNKDAEREFFEDAKRETFIGNPQDEHTVICFLIKSRPNKYAIGCSSLIVKIEEGK